MPLEDIFHPRPLRTGPDLGTVTEPQPRPAWEGKGEVPASTF